MLHRALQIETLKSVHKNGVQYTAMQEAEFVPMLEVSILLLENGYFHILGN